MTWLVGALRGVGLEVVEYPGWQTRGADKLLSRMNPTVVVAHHTATGPNWLDTSVENLLALQGNATTPPPLCHLGLRRSGVYVAIASGVANHAGPGTWKGVGSNKYAIGIEAYNAGNGEPWPKAQLDAYDLGSATLLEWIGRDASYLAAHREWRPKPIGKFGAKIDPYGINMDAMRDRVQAIMEDDEMTNTQARLEVAALWHQASGVWMTATATETAQIRLTRLAGEVVAKTRTAAQIVAAGAPPHTPSDPAEKVPAWVVDPSIPV